MQAILICSLIFIVIFFPIGIKLQGVLSAGKGYFAFSIYSIALIGGYVQIDAANLSVHLSEKRVILLDIKSLFSSRGSLKNVKGIAIYDFKSCLISGVKNSVGLTACVILSSIRDIAFPILVDKFPWLKIKSDIFLVDDDSLNYVMQIKCWINICSIISLVLKNIVEGIRNEKRMQR